MVGSRNDDDGGSSAGSAYVFQRSGTSWVQQAKLTASDAAGRDQFGSSISISGDTIVAGAKGDDDGGSDTGSVYVFEKSKNKFFFVHSFFSYFFIFYISQL